MQTNEASKAISVSIINSQPDDTSHILFSRFADTWHGSLNQLTNAVITQLSKELQIRDIAVHANASKLVNAKVESINIIKTQEGFRAFMNVQIQTGNYQARNFQVSNYAPQIPFVRTVFEAFDRTLNGAVALAVIDIMNNPDFQKYLLE